MTEFRFEPLSRRWVIAGGDRASRPNDFCDTVTRRGDLLCPFCGGHENETPTASAEYREPKAKDWSVRVVPNKYPAVNGKSDAKAPLNGCHELFTARPGSGLHEVIIESPRHVVDLPDLTPTELTNTFRAYRDRLAETANRGLLYGQIFKNVGAEAGASLEHSHSQLIGLPWIPADIKDELASSADYFHERGRSLLSSLMEAEMADGARILATNDEFVAWCPFASRFAYECRIAPRKHAADFRKTSDGEAGRLARFVADLVRRIRSAVGNVGYNLVLHTSPFDSHSYDHYHWHWEILPRLGKQAGFEFATGCFINPFLPEIAAEEIRGGSLAQSVSPH